MRTITSAIIACALLCGCWDSREASSYRVQGNAGGTPVDVVVNGRSESSSGVDVQAAISAAVAGVQGKLFEAVQQMRPPSLEVVATRLQEQIAPGLLAQSERIGKDLKDQIAAAKKDDAGNPIVPGLIGAAVPLAYGVSEALRRRKAERDAQEDYERANASAREAKELALKLPPSMSFNPAQTHG